MFASDTELSVQFVKRGEAPLLVNCGPAFQVSDIKAAIETQVSDDKFRKDLLQIVYKGKVCTVSLAFVLLSTDHR